MENEEKEDLLVEVTESEDEALEEEEIQKKILDFIQNEKPNSKSTGKTVMFIIKCSCVFLSSSILIVLLPIYLKYSSVTSITTYSKLVTLSFVNAIIFGVAHVVGVATKCGSHASPNHSLCLGDVLKVSFLLSVGSISILWLSDGNFVSCHLRDPLKGCSILFSLLFYFVFSRKKMSLERTFCAITIVVGVFITVDFGICDKFQCNGNSNLVDFASKFHFLYVILYIFVLGVWVLHFTYVEICWTSHKGSKSNLSVTDLSSSSNNSSSRIETKPSIQSLSIICQEEEEHMVASKIENLPKCRPNGKFLFRSQSSKLLNGRESDNSLNSVPCRRNQLSLPDFRRFPLTSTPNNEMDGWQSWTSGRCYDIALWQHISCCLVILGLCWVPTVSFIHNGKAKLLVEVINDVFDSIVCHGGWSGNPKCSYLPTVTILLSISYVVFVLSCIELLKTTQSAVTVTCIMMSALPMANLFWSLFQINGNTKNILEFHPEISGEAVCAVLGFPIIGIGIVLLMKSHIKEFELMI